MILWDDAIQTCQDLTSDSSTTTTTFFKRLMNVGYKNILADIGRPVVEQTKTASTVAAQQNYQMPVDFNWIKSVTITVGTTTYPIYEEESQEIWDNINLLPQQAAIPRFYFVRPRFGIAGTEILFWPTPSASSNTLTIVYEAMDKDLTQTKYTTGTATVTSASVSVTGSGTSWTSNMINRYFNITDTGGSGDGLWYRIVNVTGNTALTLENYYQGTTASGLTYQVAEMFALPEDMQILPVFYAVGMYYGIRKDKDNELKYMAYYTQGVSEGKRRYGTKSRSDVIHSKNNMSRWTVYPYYFPQSGIS